MSQGLSSPTSFASVQDDGCGDVPKPPPGPPPPSPPRKQGDENLGSKGSPPPPPPPIPPMPRFDSDKGLGLGENPNETLRTFDLPRLERETTALEFGDWLSIVDSNI